MKLGVIVVHMNNYNFTKFHQNQMKSKKVFCSELQSVSRIVKIVHSALVCDIIVHQVTVNANLFLAVNEIQRQADVLKAPSRSI